MTDKTIAQELLAHPAILSLSTMLLVRDVRAKYRLGVYRAHAIVRAARDAYTRAA